MEQPLWPDLFDARSPPVLISTGAPRLHPVFPGSRSTPEKTPGHQSHLPIPPGELCAQVQLSQGSWATRLRGHRLATSQGRSLHCHPVGGSIVLEFSVKREWRKGAAGSQSSMNPFLTPGRGRSRFSGSCSPCLQRQCPIPAKSSLFRVLFWGLRVMFILNTQENAGKSKEMGRVCGDAPSPASAGLLCLLPAWDVACPSCACNPALLGSWVLLSRLQKPQRGARPAPCFWFPHLVAPLEAPGELSRLAFLPRSRLGPFE